MTHYLLEPVWQVMRDSDLPEKQQNWLLYKDSFIERLKYYGIKQSEIIVLKHTFEKPLPSEQIILEIASDQDALVREVLIKSKEGNWMVARTIFPHQTLTGEERHFVDMKNQSLGSILFKYADLERSEFEMACLSSEIKGYKKIVDLVSIHEPLLWARRSTFKFRNKSLLLSEVFLPDVFSLG